MELHHPIMSKLWDLGGRTKRKKEIIPKVTIKSNSVNNMNYECIEDRCTNPMVINRECGIIQNIPKRRYTLVDLVNITCLLFLNSNKKLSLCKKGNNIKRAIQRFICTILRSNRKKEIGSMYSYL